MKKYLKALLASTLLFSLCACSSNTPIESSEPVETAETTPTEAPKELSGKVVVYCPSPAGMQEKIAAAFTEKTGVEVEIFQGTTGEITARLEAEAANPVADVVVLASWSDGLALKEEGNLLSYTPANADKVYAEFKDEDGMLYGTSASAVGVIYNTTVFESVDADWAELGTNPEYADQIAIPDPVKSGSAKDFLSGIFYKDQTAAQAMIEAWANNEMSVPGANKAALEAVTTGEKGILVAGVDYNAYSNIAKGEPLQIYYPEGGTVINPRPAMILKTSANVENAKAFMDFLLSDEGQQLVADAYLLPGRSDIKAEGRTNVEDIPTFDLDWTWMGEHANDIAQSILDLCQ